MILTFSVLLFPITAFSQIQNIEVIVECVEDLGNGKFMANFGYNNLNDEVVTLDKKSSQLIYNGDKKKTYVLNIFQPGRHAYVLSKEFDAGDRVRWQIKLPDGVVNECIANMYSTLCDLSIEPYYEPPEGGKVDETVLIGAELTSLYDYFTAFGAPESDSIFQISGDNVMIEINGKVGYIELKSELDINGFVISSENNNVIAGWIPIENLDNLNVLPLLINFVRPVYPAITNMGLVTTEGYLAMRADFARGGFNVNGEGITIGVISNSYDSKHLASVDVGNGDLPGAGNPDGNLTSVEVIKDIIPAYGTLSDEGRAMLQIIHDIAPKAKLIFRTGYISAEDFAAGIYELAEQCDIIVDDITYITEPFFHDGIVAQAVNDVALGGVSYFTAAGNFGSKSYQNIFNSALDTPSEINGVAHDFGGGDIYQSITLAKGIYTIVLQWDGGIPTQTDLDIFLASQGGRILFGYNSNNLNGDPIEVLPFNVTEDGTEANIVISKSSGNDVNFKYIVFRGNLSINEFETGISTIVGQANAAGAMTVGAVRYDNLDPIILQSFSSRGGMELTGGEIRNKPDFTAPNGGNTTVELGAPDYDNDGDPNFFGTSAAAPHAAALAALLLEAKIKFYNEIPHAGSPGEIRSVYRIQL